MDGGTHGIPIIENIQIVVPSTSGDLCITDVDIQQWNSSQRNRQSEGMMINDSYHMSKTDLRGLVKNHFIIFGQIDHVSAILVALKHYTTQLILYLICIMHSFVSDQSPDHRWTKIRRSHPNVVYLESSLSDVEEIRRCAIEDSFHVIMLTWFVKDSSIQDSGILPIVRIIEENFKNVKFTLELLDESNLKYLNYRPRKELGHISYNIWPRYASSNVFFSSTMDYIMAGVYFFIIIQAFHMESIVEIVGKLINSNISPNISGINENKQINILDLPDHFVKYSYIDVFQQFVSKLRCIIPLAIVRDKQNNKNLVPIVIINPSPSTIIVVNMLWFYNKIERR